MQLVFDTSIEDKSETPGEVPDPEKGGLGGARPLGMSTTSSSSPTLPRPPEHPPPPPPTVAKKPSIPAPTPPPKLDQEVNLFAHYVFVRIVVIIFKSNKVTHTRQYYLLHNMYLSISAFDVKL